MLYFVIKMEIASIIMSFYSKQTVRFKVKKITGHYFLKELRAAYKNLAKQSTNDSTVQLKVGYAPIRPLINQT